MRAGGGQQGEAGRRADTSSTPLPSRGSIPFVAAPALPDTAMWRRFDDPVDDAGATAGASLALSASSSPASPSRWSAEAVLADGDGMRTWQTGSGTEVSACARRGAARAPVGLRHRRVRSITRREDVALRTARVRQSGRAALLVPRDPADRSEPTACSACPRSTAAPVATSSEQAFQPGAQHGGSRCRPSCSDTGLDELNAWEGP